MRLYIYLLITILLYCSIEQIQAQDSIINGFDDVEFANELAKWGYYDLAESISERISKTSSSKEKKNDGDLLRCSVLQIQGNNASDPEVKSDYYKQALACYNILLKKTKGMQQLQLYMDVANIQLSQGYSFLQQAEDLEGEAKDSCLDKAFDLFKEASSSFSDLKAQTNSAGNLLTVADDSQKEQDRATVANIRYQSWFGYCRTLYFLGKLNVEHSWQNCLKELEAYFWDYNGLEGCYFATLLRGIIFQEQNNHEKAIVNFDSVLRALEKEYVFQIHITNKNNLATKNIPSHIRKAFKDHDIELNTSKWIVLQENKAWLIHGESSYLLNLGNNFLDIYSVLSYSTALNLRSQACYYKTKSLIEQEKYEEALEWVESFQKKYKLLYEKEFITEEYGQASLIELCKLYVGNEDYKKALPLVQRLAEQKTFWGRKARNLLSEWSKTHSYFLDNVKTIFQIAMNALENEDYSKAIISFNRVLDKTNPKDPDYINAKEKLAQVYWRTEQFSESGRVYEELGEQAGKINNKNLAAKATYFSYRAYQNSYKKTQHESDKEKYEKMFNILTTKYKKSSYALNRIYYQAQDKYNEANKEKDPQLSCKKYIEAEKIYKSVAKEATQYEFAFVERGNCYFKSAQKCTEKADQRKYYKEAEKILLEFLKYTKETQLKEVESQKLTVRQNATSFALLLLAKINDQLSNEKKMHEYIGQLQKDFANFKDRIAETQYILCQYYIKTKQFDKAENIAVQISNESTIDSNVKKFYSAIYNLVGKIYDSKNDEIKKMMATVEDKTELEKQSLEYRIKGFNYFFQWLDTKSNIEFKNAYGVANRILQLAQDLKAQNSKDSNEYFEKAHILFNKALSLTSDPEKIEEIKVDLVLCLMEKNEWEKSIQMFYPIYHADTQSRLEKRQEEAGPRGLNTPTTQKTNLNYMNALSEIFLHIAEQTSFVDVNNIYSLIYSNAQIDWNSDLRDFTEENRDTNALVQKYIKILENISWIQNKPMDDQVKKNILDEASHIGTQYKDERPKFLKFYQNKCKEAIEKAFQHSQEESLDDNQKILEIQRICIQLGYEFSSTVLNGTAYYLHKKQTYGAYNNPLWWEAKYRQLYFYYLLGNKAETKNFITVLKKQQKTLGGPQYRSKFEELLKKTEK